MALQSKILSFLSIQAIHTDLLFYGHCFSEATEISISLKGRQFWSPSLGVSPLQSGYFGLMLARG